MDILDPDKVQVEFDMEEVHATSVDLLSLLEDDGIDVGLGVAALALSLGRLLSPKAPMEIEEEIRFIQACMEWSGLYFVSGGVN